MTTYRFSVPGIPVAKGRPRFTKTGDHVRTYTPEATQRFEARVAAIARVAGVQIEEGPVHVTIAGVWPTRGAPRKREPRPVCWKPTTPDIDNLCKSVLDAMNGIAYLDDAQVVSIYASKEHAAQGDAPRTDVTIQPADQSP